jgi:hypothetical protein
LLFDQVYTKTRPQKKGVLSLWDEALRADLRFVVEKYGLSLAEKIVIEDK